MFDADVMVMAPKGIRVNQNLVVHCHSSHVTCKVVGVQVDGRPVAGGVVKARQTCHVGVTGVRGTGWGSALHVTPPCTPRAHVTGLPPPPLRPCVQLTLKPIGDPCAVAPFKASPALGRLVLRESRATLGVGVVVSVNGGWWSLCRWTWVAVVVRGCFRREAVES